MCMAPLEGPPANEVATEDGIMMPASTEEVQLQQEEG